MIKPRENCRKNNNFFTKPQVFLPWNAKKISQTKKFILNCIHIKHLKVKITNTS